MYFALFSWHWKQGCSIYLHITCLCTLFSLDELIYCTLLVKLCSTCCVGKMFIIFDHFVLILKSHVFDCRTWTFGSLCTCYCVCFWFDQPSLKIPWVLCKTYLTFEILREWAENLNLGKTGFKTCVFEKHFI